MPELIIEVDELEVTVDADAYIANPAQVEQQVRDVRAALQLDASEPVAPDYDAFTAQWGTE